MINNQKKLVVPVAICLLFLGAFLRYLHFMQNFSLHADEAWLAHDLISRSFKDVLFNLNDNPQYPNLPAGFLLVEKIFAHLLGYSEQVLRIFPLICSWGSLVLLYILLKSRASHFVAAVTLAFFALSQSHIYYAAFLKQYSSDVFFTILMYAIVLSSEKTSVHWRRLAVQFIIGLWALFSSHSILFVIAGLGISQLLFWQFDENDKTSKKYLAVYIGWAAGFILLWFIYYRSMFRGEYLEHLGKYHQESFFYLMSGQMFYHFITRFIAMFDNPAGLAFPLLGTLVFLLGAESMFKSQKKFCVQLLIPMFLIIIASVFQKYPFQGRFLLFLLPMVYIILAEGLYCLIKKGKWLKLAGILITVMLLWQPAQTAIANINYAVDKRNIRPLLKYLEGHQNPGDVLIINNSASMIYNFYKLSGEYNFDLFMESKLGDKIHNDQTGNYIFFAHAPHNNGEGDPYKYYKLYFHHYKPITLIKDQRTWILNAQLDEATRVIFTKLYDSYGQKLLENTREGAELYLYDFSQGAKKSY